MPKQFEADVPHVAADLFDWDNVEIRRFGEHQCNLPGHARAGKLQDLQAKDYRLAYHGTNAYALYAQIYHGKLPISGSSVDGERALKGFAGVYLFDETAAPKNVFEYVYKAQLG